MAAELVWRVTCDLCGRVDDFAGGLNTAELGDALKREGWHLPIYGGTFHRTCYNRMRQITSQPPLPEPDPVAELLETVQRVKNIVWQNFGIEPGSPLRALPERKV